MTTLLRIIQQPKYLFLAVLVATIFIVLAAWLPNLHLVTKTMTSKTMTLWQKTNLLTSLLGSLETNFSTLSRTTTIVSAGLAGIQTSLMVYYLRQTTKIQQSMGMSVMGVIASLLGVGCASCGSVILTTFIGLGSASALLGVLPLRGQEFAFIGMIMLLAAILFTMKKINQPYLCKVGN